MEQKQVQLGQVTYQIQRICCGSRPIRDLIIAQTEHMDLVHPAFDGDGQDVV